jgi:hypothetical protein
VSYKFEDFYLVLYCILNVIYVLVRCIFDFSAPTYLSDSGARLFLIIECREGVLDAL